jgi:hypothetical protein
MTRIPRIPEGFFDQFLPDSGNPSMSNKVKALSSRIPEKPPYIGGKFRNPSRNHLLVVSTIHRRAGGPLCRRVRSPADRAARRR